MTFVLWLKHIQDDKDIFMGIFSKIELANEAGQKITANGPYSDYYYWVSVEKIDKIKGDW